MKELFDLTDMSGVTCLLELRKQQKFFNKCSPTGMHSMACFNEILSLQEQTARCASVHIVPDLQLAHAIDFLAFIVE